MQKSYLSEKLQHYHEIFLKFTFFDYLTFRKNPGCYSQPPPSSSGRLSWASSCLNAGACLVLTAFGLVLGLHLVHLSLNRRSDIFCGFMSGQSVLATCILAQKHNLHFREGKVWFMDFIG